MKNLIKIPRNYDARFCWQNAKSPETNIINENLKKNPLPEVIEQNNYVMGKAAKKRIDNDNINRMLEHLESPNLKNKPEGFEAIPASLFLKLSAENLRILFIDKTGTINFRGNSKAEREIGLTDLFPKIADNKQQFVVLDGETYAYGARRHDGKIGYGNPEHKAITGDEHIDFFIGPPQEENGKKTTGYISYGKEKAPNENQDYENLTTNIASFGKLENLTVEQEKAEKEKFIKETEHVEEVEEKYRELIDFPADIPAISLEQINSAAQKLEINPAIIKAIISVESKNAGNTRFEPHIYKKYQNSPLNADEKGLTQMATSFGSFQIMGFNYESAGFSNVNSMVQAMKTPKGQIDAFVNFVENNSTMHTALQKEPTPNWQTFAKLYNGPDYAKNDYDTKISNQYHKFLVTG
jgi:hypothetical protein